MITGIPIIVRGAMVASSSVVYPDTGETLWVIGGSYSVGNTVSYLIGDLYHKFECKQAHTGAANKAPEPYPLDEENGYWIDLGAVNAFAPFQLERNTQNDAESPYFVTVIPDERVRHIAVGNVLADEVTLEVYDENDDLVYTKTERVLERITPTINDWIYAKHRQIDKVLFSDLPTHTTHYFKLTFIRDAGNVRVGFIIPTVAYEIGSARYGAVVRRENLSTIERKFDGEVKLTPRRNVPVVQLDLIMRKIYVDRIVQLIDDLNAKVTFFAGIVLREDGYFESLFVIGFYSDFSYSLDYPRHAQAKIEIKEI